MPLMRNPFRSKPNDLINGEQSVTAVGESGEHVAKVDSWGNKSASMRSTSSVSETKPTEYKMSEISDDGHFLPPSPSETKSSFWSTRSGASTRTSSHRSMLNDNEPFSISRESFDSYRRSFDISARSPVIDPMPTRTRQSLDARQLRLPSSHASSPPNKPTMRMPTNTPRRPSNTPFQPQPVILPDNHVNPPLAEPEEPENAAVQQPNTQAPTNGAQVNGDRFEDVGLGDAADRQPTGKKPQQTKKPGIFSRFGADHGHNAEKKEPERPGSSGLGIGLGMFGRKRGASGQGAELGSMPQPQSQTQTRHTFGHSKKDSIGATTQEVKVDS